MKRLVSLIILVLIYTGCDNKKLGLPDFSDFNQADEQKAYVQLTPVWDSNYLGESLNQPKDILLGWDNFLYVCDSGNNRILMIDLLGDIQSVSQYIENPVAVTQDQNLNLFVVNESNHIFRIDLVSNNHILANASIDTVHSNTSNTSIYYRGITSYYFDQKHKIFAAAVDYDEPEYGEIIDFEYKKDNPAGFELERKGPMPLFNNGQGLYVVKQPTCVKSQRIGRVDFLYGHVGENNFLVQGVATFGSGEEQSIGPNIYYVGSDLYAVNAFINPVDIDVDKNGFIFVLDSSPQAQFNLYRFNSSGDLVRTRFDAPGDSTIDVPHVIGGPDNSYGQGDMIVPLNQPQGVAVTYEGIDPTVYISDTGNNRILLFRLSTELD